MHIYDVINEAEKIIHATRELYKSETKIEELNKWSQILTKFRK